jgi:hypothetical protein
MSGNPNSKFVPNPSAPYIWELSLDQTSWSSTTTGKTQATLTGLTPGKTYWLRVHAFLRDGTTTTPVPAISFIAR